MSRQPREAEVLRAVVQSFLEEVHVALPAKVKSYDKAKQVAQVQITILRASKTRREVIHEDYPIIENVPVCWPEGGGYSIQLPLAAGDHVVLIFSEWSYAQWRTTGAVSKPGDLTRHDLSYPFAIPSVRPDSKPLPNPGDGALVTTPAGGALSVSTDGGAPKEVAMAEEVNANFQAIKDMFTQWVVVAQDGGAALKTLSGDLSFEDTKSSNLKAE